MTIQLHILVVDDDHHVRELIARTLIQNGYKVDMAKDGAEAWKALSEVSYDLLITDHKMPRVTGVELIKKLQSEDMTLPVILISGTMPTEELKLHPWLRIDAMLPKPFDIPELLGVVEKVLPILSQTPFADLMLHPEKLEAALKTAKIPVLENAANTSSREQTNLPYRILVVDDDNDIRQLSMDVLAESGYKVEGVKDGAAGWDALQDDDYDLIITDNKMPKMTGIEMIAKLRSARMIIPVIMATGNLPRKVFAHNPWLKPAAMLERPFSNDVLLGTVKSVLCAPNDDDSKDALLPKYL